MPDESLRESADAFAASLVSSPITLSATEADPPIITLGLAIGLLMEDEANPDTYGLNPDWFSDPIGKTGDGLSSGGPALAALIAQLIGAASGSSLGIPVQAPANLGEWYPILDPTTKDDPKPTGLYIASTPSGENASTLGAGVLHETSVTLSELRAGQEKDQGLTGPDRVDLKVWGLVPILKMDGSVTVAMGSRDGPITIGFQVTAGEGEVLISSSGFSFTGIRLTCDLAFLPSPTVTTSLVIESLSLPTQPEARDYTLADLEAVGGGDLLALAASLAMGALTRAVGALPATSYILPAVGLGPTVPGMDGVRLPILRWDEFAALAISAASDPSVDIARPIRDWFTTIAADGDLLQAWLASVGGLVAEASGTTPSISGGGDRVDPYKISLFSVSSIGDLFFTVGTAVDAEGLRHLYPGLTFETMGTVVEDAARFQAVAALELMDFLLTPGGAGVSLTGNFSAGLRLTGPKDGDPLFSGTLGGQTYEFDSLRGAFNLINANGVVSLLPSFELVKVTTPTNLYDVLDLLNPKELVEVAADELASAISAAFNSLFNTESSTVGQSLAALLGVSEPPLPTDAIWPADLAPPFGSSRILNSMQSPVTAYTAYWSTLIATGQTVQGQKPIYYMVSALGQVLTLSGVSPGGVSGTGVGADPWKVALGPEGTVISLMSYLDTPADGATRLTTGLVAGSSVPVMAGSTLALDLRLGLLSLVARNAVIETPTILPVLAVVASLPEGFTTPEVAGAALSVGPSSLVLDWRPASGWHWNMAVGAPALEVDGVSQPVGEAMDYSDSSALESLVTDAASTFAPILTGVLGIALYRAQARAGLALNGWFGLLPNLAPHMPDGLNWPDDMPVMTPTSFDDPIGQVRAQVQAILADGDKAVPALQLLAWAITSSAETAPEVSGAGTQLNPYQLDLGLFSGTIGTLWQPEDKSALTLGLGYTTQTEVGTGIGAVTLSTALRLDAFALDWSTGKPASLEGVPSLSCAAVLAMANGDPLVERGGISVQTVGLRVSLNLSASFAVTSDLFLSTSEGERHTLGANPVDVAAMTTLVNAAFQAALASLRTSDQFDPIYGLLSQLGLMIPASGDSAQYGLDGDGWMALTSDGLGFLRTRFTTVLADTDQLADLIDVLKALSGLNPPSLPASLSGILTGLGLVVPGAGGTVVPNPEGIVAMARDPAGNLVQRFQTFMGDEAVRGLVMSTLTDGFQSTPVGPFTFDVRNGRTLSLALSKDNAIALGAFAALVGEVGLDLVTGKLGGTAELFVPEANAGLATSLSAILGEAPVVTTGLTWGDGSVPLPAPLQLYPFDAEAFITSLSEVAPAYALSVFVSRVVEARILPDYPLARMVLHLFGLVEQQGGSSGPWVMKSTLGLFEDPLDWLLSDAVIGADGTLNLQLIQDILTGLPPGAAPGGLTLVSTEMGATVTGLPYGLQVAVTADPSGAGALTITPCLAQTLPLFEGTSLNKLAVGLTLSAACQPGFTLDTDLSADIPGLSNGLSVRGGYDKLFMLSFGESGEGNPSVQLLPFLGWASLVQQLTAAAAQALLPTLTDKVLDGLAQNGAGTLANSLRTAGTNLEVSDLLTKLLGAVPNPSAMEQAALDWLSDRLDPANAGGTARAVVGLFSPYVDGISADDTGLVTYVPSSSIPLTVLAGVRTVGDTRLIGLWARGSVAVGAFATVGLAPTGAGMALPDTTLVPSFGFTVQALVTGSEGPGLVAGLDGGLSLSMDPLMDAGATGDLVVELLPQPFGVPGSQVGDAVTVWLLKVATLALPRYASALVLNTATVRQWLDAPLFPNGSTLTAAQVLQGAQLIVDDRGTYVLNSLTNLMNLGIDGFLAGFLRTLMETQVKILSLPQDGGIWVEPGSTAGSFGLRVQAPDMKLPDTTRFVFQLGASDTEWITLAGGSEDIIERAGVSIYLPIADNVPQFAELQVNLINIGVDFQGSGGQPLMDLTRFKMGAVKPRGLLTMDFAKSSFVTGYGGGFDVADIQISLAPNTAVEGENANPVAQNLMGAGSKASDVANPSVNPGFTLTAGWLNTGHLGVEFRDGEGDPKAELWIPIQRTFGPVHADQIGIGYQNDTNRGSVMFDGSLSLAGLTVELVDLSVSVNFAQITDYTQYSLDLGGLAVSFNGGGVSVAGGLLKKSDPIRYDGMLLVKFSTFSIYAIGSFGLVPVDADKPEGDTAVSFFAFLNLNAPLGGVPEFFIEGIAGGFGINRGLTVPGAGDLMSFPLIQGAISSSYFGEDAGPAKALEKMGDSVPPVVGDYWIAGGFRFSTYKILTVFAMLMVRFGKEFEIDLIGVAQASLPPEVPVDKALAYVELGMVASFKPTEGEISVTAQLTTNSFLLTKSCRLTGGFAAIYWYGSNKNAGDFVITLGGYHPAFDPPDHYPVVPRLGFNWPVIDEDALSLKVYGGAYFALTPSMVMAGAELKASFEAGPLSAWFDAGANFLIAWQPFYYMAEIHISVGAALTVEAFGVKATLSAELGALLELWGPETAGRVKVNWYIIKFTIPFGNQDEDESSTKPLSWDQFVIRMLPSGQAEGGAPASVRAMAVTGAATGKRDDAGADPVILNAQVTQGLLRTEDDGTMVVQARPLEFTLGTAIPATTLSVTGLTGSVSGAAIGVRPMEVTEVTTALVVTFEVKNTQTGAWDAYPVTGDQFVLAGTSKPSPGAMWAREAFDPQGLPSAKAVDNTLTGLTLTSGADVPFNPIGPMDLLEAFGYDQAPILALPFAVTPNYDAAPEYGQTNAFSQMMTSVMAPTVVNERSAIWGAVIDHGLTAITAPNLSILSGFADLIYVAPPAIAPLTQDVLHAPANPATVQVAKVAAMAARTTPEEETVETQARPPRLVGTAKVRSRRGSRRTTAQWRAASVHDTPTAPAAAGVPSSVQARTSAAAGPGDMALFELGTGGVTASLDSHGRARVVEIDHLGRVHADRVVDGGAAVPLSDRTARIALVGTAKEAEMAAGWSSDTQVFQAGLHTLIAPGCRIRVQASPRGRHRARELKQTVLSAAEILRRDRVQTAGGGTQSGWVETLFPTVPQAILVAHEGVAPEVRMTARPDAGPRTLGPVVAPISTHDRNGHQVSVYPVPEVEDGAELGVWIAQAEGILGVHASHEAPHGLIAQAMPARAPSFGAPLPRAADVLSQGREVRLKAQAQSVADGVPRATPSGPRAVPSFHLTAA